MYSAPPDTVAEALRTAGRADPIVERFFTNAEWSRTPFPKSQRPRVFTMGHCQIFVGHEPLASNGELRWHLSIAHPWRLPTWDEIKMARAELLPPDLHFSVPMPPAEFWINVHNFCLHLWEVDDPALTASWEAEVQS